MSWILGLLIISWLAIFSSQSLVDLADSLVIGTALYIAFKQNNFKNLLTSFRPSLLWPIWIFIILIGLFLNTDLKTPGPWKDFFEFRWILTFLSWIYILRNLADHKKSFNILAILTILLNLAALVVWFKNPSARAGGLLGSAMSFAHNLAPLLSLFTVLLITNWKNFSKQEKILTSVVVITSGVLVILTFTRGVWIGSVLAILTTTFLWNRKVFASVLVALTVVFLIGISTSERFSNRVFTKTANEIDSNQERTALWRGNWEMIKEHPLFGVGLGANKSHLRKYYDIFGYPEGQRQSHAHNQYLQYWAGTGTVGLLCFLSFLFFVLKYSYNGFKNNRTNSYVKNLQLALLAALICFLVGSLTESNFNIAKNRFFFLILAGMAVAWSRSSEKSKN